MHLLQAVLLRCRVFRWLVLLISLWVAIVSGLAFSGAANAESEARAEPAPVLPAHGISLTAPQQGPRTVLQASKPGLPMSVPVEPPAPKPSTSTQHRSTNTVLIDGEPRFVWPPSSKPVEFPFLLESECPTPMSLMLHSGYGPVRMWKLAREIVARGLQTTTYREVAARLESGRCPAEGSLIVSLDDFGTDWLRPYFVTPSEIFADRGLVLVIAAVVGGPQDPDAWAYLRRLEGLGFEVASHGLDHYSLSQIEPERIEEQVAGSYEVICRNLGRCPVTLVLPFGNIDEFGLTYAAARDFTFVVGIPGGRRFGGEPPFYVGRIGPDSTEERATLRALAASFGLDRSSSFAMRALEQLKSARCFASPARFVAAPHFRCSRAQSGSAPNLGSLPQDSFAPLPRS
ncbi:MAG: hypothetical protein BMS9Abin28_2029 [Anaerolineae bacterium]|nr:MAG: hypothetical protein BMS9Abin28_2029 [Anaerolineae bacterium]